MNPMKIAFLTLIIIVSFYFPLFSSSQEIAGHISHNTTWESDTIKVTGDIVILEGTTHTITPGSYLEFQGNYRIDVKGTLIAEGSDNDSIIFTTNDSVQWLGIVFDSTSTDNDSSVISFCRLENATHSTYHGGAFHIVNYSKVRIDNCLIQNNSGRDGGAIHCDNASPLIKNNVLLNNQSRCQGGAIYCSNNSIPLIANNIIQLNYASPITISRGGGICCENAHPFIINNLIVNNHAFGRDNFGGGIACLDESNPKIINCTIANNNAKFGGGIYCQNSLSQPVIINTILWGNSKEQFNNNLNLGTVSHSTIQGGYPGTEIDTLYPLFTDTINGDWSLTNISPCINKGKSDTTDLSLPPKDIAGNPRITHGRIDIGAYEYQGIVSINTTDSLIKDDEAGFTALPNPATDEATVKFFFNSRNSINAELNIYDPLGNRIFSNTYPIHAISNSAKRDSFAEWNMRNEDGKPVSAGSYLVILNTENQYGESKVYRLILGIASGETH